MCLPKKVEFKYKMSFVAKKWLYFWKKRGIVFSIGGENIVLNRKATSEASFKRSIRINKKSCLMLVKISTIKGSITFANTTLNTKNT